MATINSASNSQSDVAAAIARANRGDTVKVPGGTVTWSSGVSINKGITIEGAGAGSLTIKRASGWMGNVIHIKDLPADDPVRITGIKFDNVIQTSQNSPDVFIERPQFQGGAPSYGYTKIRIDHCDFAGGHRVIYWMGWAYGVVDHCNFKNVLVAGQFSGYTGDNGNISWGRKDAIAGSGNFPIYEDCVFEFDNDGQTPPCPWVFYHEYGGRSVMRHCKIDSSKKSSSIEGPVDCHGNQSYWKNHYNDMRGTIRMEFYENEVHLNNSFRVMDLRGGSHLIHHNKFVFDNSSPRICDFRDEEVDPRNTPGIPVRNPVTWPCEDQINNTFIWANTINGRPQQDSDIGVGTFGNASNDAKIEQKNRDWWTKAPDSTTKTDYPTPAAPSSPNYPNQYLPVSSYTPYPYPHPLIGGEEPPPGGGGTPPPDGGGTPPVEPPAEEKVVNITIEVNAPEGVKVNIEVND